MNNPSKTLATYLAVLAGALAALTGDAIGRNIFKDFTTAPTFTPPAGCAPVEQTYGVISRCEKKIEPGRTFVALIDTAVGWGAPVKLFVDDHVEEIRDYWTRSFKSNKVSFSSKVSKIVPANVPLHQAECREYSILVEPGQATDQEPMSRVQHVEGLTCAWRVDNPKEGKPDVELFWLEAYDDYAPSLGQRPMESFDRIVQELFASVRL